MGMLKNACSAVGAKLVCGVLNRKAKRMMLVVSLATYLHTLHNGGELPLNKINQLNISTKDNALEFPRRVAGTIWKDSGIDQLDLSSDVDSIATQLLERVPSYLRYGRDAMAKDIKDAVRVAMV